MTMLTARLILAILSTIAEEAAIFVIWRWGLPELGIYWPQSVLFGVMGGWLVVSVAIFVITTLVLRRQTIAGLPSMIGTKGKVASLLAPEGMVRIRSELWSATSQEGAINKGEEIIVVAEDGLKLVVCRNRRDALPSEGQGRSGPS